MTLAAGVRLGPTISSGSTRRSVTFPQPCSKLRVLSTRVSTKPEQDPSLALAAELDIVMRPMKFSVVRCFA